VLALLKWIGLGLAIVGIIVLPFILFGAEAVAIARGLADAGGQAGLLVALAIVALFAGDVFLPVPSSLLSVAAVALYGWAGGLLIWLGMTLGCAIGYWLGSRAGRPLAERVLGPGEIARAERIAADVGPAALVVTRAVPVLAEAATVAAGLAAMPLGRFALATGLANAGIAFVYVAAAGSFALLFTAAILVPALGWIGLLLYRRLRSV